MPSAHNSVSPSNLLIGEYVILLVVIPVVER